MEQCTVGRLASDGGGAPPAPHRDNKDSAVRAAIGAVDVTPGDGERAIAEMAAAGVTILDD